VRFMKRPRGGASRLTKKEPREVDSLGGRGGRLAGCSGRFRGLSGRFGGLGGTHIEEWYVSHAIHAVMYMYINMDKGSHRVRKKITALLTISRLPVIPQTTKRKAGQTYYLFFGAFPPGAFLPTFFPPVAFRATPFPPVVRFAGAFPPTAGLAGGAGAAPEPVPVLLLPTRALFGGGACAIISSSESLEDSSRSMASLVDPPVLSVRALARRGRLAGVMLGIGVIGEWADSVFGVPA
jgi:hypothetical protein